MKKYLFNQEDHDCVKEYGFTCCMCSKVNSEGIVDIDGSEYCSECADIHLEFCDGCGEYHSTGEFSHTEDGLGYCGDCVEDGYVADCEECGGFFSERALRDGLCKSCR